MEKEDRLNCDAIDMEPHDYDFSQGYGERWESFEAAECDKCGEVLMLQGEAHHHELDNDSECDGYLSTSGPMMNYYYLLPDFEHPEDGAKKIVHLPLCIVHFEDSDEYALALTGGGMDLSWEICAAYIELGYWPPTHFAGLPKMAGGPGIGLKAGRRVLNAMRESIRIKANWLSGESTGLKSLEDWMIELEKDRRKRDAEEEAKKGNSKAKVRKVRN